MPKASAQLTGISRKITTVLEQAAQGRPAGNPKRFYNEFKAALLNHFKSAGEVPGDLAAELERLNPPHATRQGDHINREIAADINESRNAMLPYAAETKSSPFGILSQGRYANVKTLTFFESRQTYGWGLLNEKPRHVHTIVTRDKKDNDLHICFTAIPDYDPRKWIHTFAGDIVSEITGNRNWRWSFSGHPAIHFYIHLPPEFDGKEEYMKVEMDREINGNYSNPRFTSLSEIPAGLHRSLIDVRYRDPHCTYVFETHDIWRRFAVKSRMDELSPQPAC